MKTASVFQESTNYPEVLDNYDIVLLHGLFGNLSNWEHVEKEFSEDYRIHAPALPLFDLSWSKKPLDVLVEFVKTYLDQQNLKKVVLIGNSLGGHIAILFTLKYPDRVSRLVLTGSSGLYENAFSNTFPRVRDLDYLRERVSYTFYNKEVVTDALLEQVFSTIQSPGKTLSIINLARSAQRHNLRNFLSDIKVPVLLLWGMQDQITPPAVAANFKELLPVAELKFIDECGHAPMMEQPVLFNQYLKAFLEKDYGI
jgi:pimeloyl-ACP methyl ester carboxylesterase